MALTDYVIMPGADYQALVDKIKEKTGKTDPLVSGQLAAELDNISGGTSEDVRYVTFKSYDGVTEYGKKAVAVGDDCADPITRGLFTTPTRESTDQYNYTFAGWATTVGGGLSSNALKTVNEDRTVYANFAAVVRYYTIRSYDGETLLESQSVAYGSTPSIANPEKSGYSFEGWEPAISAVTGDTDYYAKWTEKVTFAGGSWADIARISEAGEAADYFAVGDTKTITADGITMTLRIIGFDHDTLADGSGKAGMTIVSEQQFTDTMSVSNWTTLASTMKSVLKPKLPSELQAVIKAVTKDCDVADAVVSTPIQVTFELFPLSYAECKIQVQGGRNTTSSDWTKVFTPLGNAYKYFEDKYNSTWKGPYSTFLSKDNNCWYRQWQAVSSTSIKGLYNDANMVSNLIMYAASAERTEKKTVMFAFCI